MLKRLIDVMCAVFGVLVYLPVWVFAGILIWMEDGQPILEFSPVLGSKRKPFYLLRLRTSRDGQTTVVGHFVRILKLDETVRLANVLFGHMSIVGPRPLTEAEVERLGWQGQNYDSRFAVAPGLTGISQLFECFGPHYAYNLDKYYLRNSSLQLDLKIVVCSVVGLFVGAKASRDLGRYLKLSK